MSNESHGSPNSKARLCPSSLTQIQIERLKREDEDEHWISGEELCTEGSSDDEEDRVTRDATASDCISHNLENVRVSSRGPGQPGRPRWSHPGSPRGQCAALRYVPSTHAKNKIGSIPSSEIPNQNQFRLHDLTDGNTDLSLTEDRSKSAEESEPNNERSEISWRPKRDEDEASIKMLEETITELRELRIDYREIFDSVSELKSLNEDVTIGEKLNVTTGGVTNELESASRVINSDRRTRIEEISKSFFSGDDGELLSCSDTSISEDRMKKEIFNVVKLDKWIGQLDEKIKKERDATRLQQILNREELRRLQSLREPETGRLAKNSIQFFKLFDYRAKMDIDQSPVEEPSVDQEMKNFCGIYSIHTPNDSEDVKTDEGNLENLVDDKESRRSRREKLEEKLTLIEKKAANFIERNKELASCATGTLAITDEEKKRLEELVRDCDEDYYQGSTSTNLSSSTVITPYTIDKEADELLKNLTEQLANMNSETYRKAEEKQEREFLSHKEQLVLNSLRTLAESSSQIIDPISEEEIRCLIDEYYVEKDASTSSRLSIDHFPSEILTGEIDSAKRDENNVRDEDSVASYSSTVSKCSTVSREVIEQLVKEAKTQMPFFRFKYHAGLIEGTNEEEERE